MTGSQPDDIFQPGDVLNNTYRIEAILGRGGTSEVYRARSEISGRVVALKVLSSEFSRNEDYLVLMNREEEIRDVRHDAVIRYSENNRSQDGHIYLVMDYIEGVGLDQVLREGGMSPEDLLILARRVAEGLVATHERNIVHRDLSPDNIILRGGDPAEAVIIDYGIAKDSNPGAATIVGNEFAGKYAYAAPEQLSGRTDARSDIYSLGALLLAMFRGEAPDMGRNPMEVIQKKAEAPDVSGVPEPLGSLIERMTRPDPEARFQSARELIDAIGGGTAMVAEPAMPIAGVPPKKREAARETAKKKSRGWLFAAGAAVLLALVGGVLWFSGQIGGAKYPVADPYTLIAAKEAGAAPIATGYMPSEQARTALDERLSSLGGTSEIALASGSVPPDWPDDILQLIDVVAPLETWRIMASGQEVRISGVTRDRSDYDAVRTSLAGSGMPTGLDGTVDIALGPLSLRPDEVRASLRDVADCGPLELADPPDGGYALGETVTVRGAVASPETKGRLTEVLRDVVGDRLVMADVEVLNPALCAVQNVLPEVPAGGSEILFGFGATGAENPEGVFSVGDNPVIDVVIPADITTGKIWITIVDVTGNAYHLLPNLSRPDNDVADLRGGAEGPFTLRIAHSLEEAADDPSLLAFRVDDTFGKSKVLVMYYDGTLFPALRPTTESQAGFAEALRASLAGGEADIRAIDTRILDSR